MPGKTAVPLAPILLTYTVLDLFCSGFLHSKQLQLSVNSWHLGSEVPPKVLPTSQGCQGREGTKKAFNPGVLLMKYPKFRLCSLQVQLYLQLQRYTKKNKIYLNLGSIFRLY